MALLCLCGMQVYYRHFGTYAETKRTTDLTSGQKEVYNYEECKRMSS
jgi:hypothetical protein